MWDATIEVDAMTTTRSEKEALFATFLALLVDGIRGRSGRWTFDGRAKYFAEHHRTLAEGKGFGRSEK